MLNPKRLSSALVVISLAACGSDHSDVSPGGDGGAVDGGGGGDGGVDGEDPLELYKSGTRIKMRVLTSPDGAKQFQGWQDTARNEACAFARASDGTTRCLPFPTANVRQRFDYFADSNCTIPVLFLSTCDAQKPYVITRSFDSCGAEGYGPVHRLGPVYTGTLYYSSLGVCSQSSATPDPDEELRSLGLEVPLSEFQSATEAVE